MQRFFLPALLLAALAVAGCGSNNKKNNNTPATTPVAGNLVPRNTTPSVAATAPGTPIAGSVPVSVGSPTPIAGGSPRAVAATTPAAPTATSPTAASGTATSAASAAATSAAAPSATAAATATSAAAASASTATATATAASASGGPSDPRALIDAVKPGDSDLPSGFTPGQFSGYQANDQAILGFANPQDVLSLLNSTGRQDGFIEQVNGPNGTFALSIQVWQDAAGAKTFFDQHPVPDNTVQFKTVQLDQPLGEQYQALLIGSGAQATYALSWRVGRVVLGIGGAAGADGKPSADMLQLADFMTKRAQAAQQ
jgi:hypothetical protein